MRTTCADYRALFIPLVVVGLTNSLRSQAERLTVVQRRNPWNALFTSENYLLSASCDVLRTTLSQTVKCSGKDLAQNKNVYLKFLKKNYCELT